MNINLVNNYPSLRFGTTRTQKIVNDTLINSNRTDFCRSDMDWNRFSDYLIKKYPNGTKIHCYACSDGSEPYTVTLKLIKKLGKKEAQKFFPIIASDIDEDRIKKNNEGILGLRKAADLHKIRMCLQQTGIKLEDILSPAKVSPEKIQERYKYEIKQYEIKGILKDAVKFKTANIVEDTKKKFPKNSVIMFRNAWAYLKPEEERQLTQNLNKNLSKNSMVVIGAFEHNYSYATEHLLEKSFRVVDKKEPMIKTGHKITQKLPLGVVYKGLSGEFPGVFLKK